MKSLSRRTRTALVVALIAVICLAMLILTNRNTAYQSKGFYDTPEDAFKAEFQALPDVVIPCGDHMHMYGPDKHNPYEKENVYVCAVASTVEAGWRISEKPNLMTIRFNRDNWADPDGWSNLRVYWQTKCRNNFVTLDGYLSDASATDLVLNKISDTAGTEFVIRNLHYPAVGDLYIIYGVVPAQENGYKLYFDSECIYP